MSDMVNEQEVMGRRRAVQHLQTLYWACVLIWAGLIFGADSLGILPQIGDGDPWTWVFLGAGLLAIVGDIYRVASPDWPDPTGWDYVWAGFLLVVGLGGILNVDVAFPVILLVIGVAVLVNALFRRS